MAQFNHFQFDNLNIVDQIVNYLLYYLKYSGMNSSSAIKKVDLENSRVQLEEQEGINMTRRERVLLKEPVSTIKIVLVIFCFLTLAVTLFYLAQDRQYHRTVDKQILRANQIEERQKKGEKTENQRVEKLQGVNNNLNDSINKLEQSNLKLKESIKTLEESNVKLKESNAKQEENNKKLKENITKLEENNKKLKENNTNLENNIKLKENNTKPEQSAIKLKENITKLEEDNKKLKENIVKLENNLKQTQAKLKAAKIEPTVNNTQIANNPHQIIQIPYQTGQVSSLPIDPLMKNKEGKTIAQFLYTEQLRKKRLDFQKAREQLVSSNKGVLYLTKYNIITNEEAKKLAVIDNQKNYQRLLKKFPLPNEEIPMCIVSPSYNNFKNFRIEYNLNSVFLQNYTNYKIVIINDASSDGSGEIFRNYFKFYKIDKKYYTYIQNRRRVTALQNIYFAPINYCAGDSIVLSLDGDDQLIGRNVLKTFNWAYQANKAGVVYSNFIYYNQEAKYIYPGFTKHYTQDEKANNKYRAIQAKFSQLRSYRNELLHQINPKDLQDQKGQFFTMTSDVALFFPLLQLSCGRVMKIDEQYNYLYNIGTGLNDQTINQALQGHIARIIRDQKKYQCYQKFNNTLKV